MYLAIALPWALVLVLMWALLEGQPAAAEADRAHLASYRATIQAYPTPTAPALQWCYSGGSSFYNAPHCN